MSGNAAPKKTFVLVDGNALVYRSFFAIGRLTNRAGLPTNAVYGFATVLRKLIAEESPELALVTFDAGGKTFRHERFKEYKANRPPMPDDLGRQLPYTRKLCHALGLTVLEVPGVEADDLIGTLARRGVEQGHRVLIVSSDKDFLQLVDDDITVIHPGKDEPIDREGVKAKFGVAPSQVVDVLALMGDSVDNIPGVPGIGEKGAAKLVAQWGSVESLLDHANEVTAKKQRESLLTHREQALLSKELVTIATDLDLEVDFEQLHYGGADRNAAFALFEELGFTTLLKEYLPEEAKELPADFRELASLKELDAFVERTKGRGRLAMWLDFSESRGFDPWETRLLGVGLAIEPGEGVYVDTTAAVSEEKLFARLKVLMDDESVLKIGHDLKNAVVFFGARAVELRGIEFDTRIASYVLNPSRRSQELSELLLEFLQISVGQVSAEPRQAQGILPGVSLEPPRVSAGALNAERAERLLRLRERMNKRILEEELEQVFRKIELPLIAVLSAMELAGIAIDEKEFAAMSAELESELERLTKTIHEMAGTEFNINSPRQLGEVLFEKMNLPSFKKTQKSRAASTRVEVLEELALHFEFPKRILDYRSLAKLKGTYVDALPALVHPGTRRIHTTFNQTVAATGRLSSSDPNLQNIPIRTELGRRLRRAFVAPPGSVLLSADYSQIELRVLAHLSGDQALIEAFEQDADIHDRTAREVFGEDPSLSEAEKRRRAKVINFSIIYGKTAFTLGKEFGVPTREAQAFIDHYFERYPKVRDLLDDIIREARRTGKVRTLFGRQRYVPEVGSRNRNTRMAAERVAVNTPIQGSAADLIKKAMLDLASSLTEEKCRSRLLLQVHDELVLEVPEEELEMVTGLVRVKMEEVYPMAVPLRVDIKTGRSWEH